MAATFLNWSRKCSENGNYFPVWGTCKGLQQIITAAICPDVDLDMNSLEYPIGTCTNNDGKGTIFRKGPDWDKSHFIQTLPKSMTEKLLLGNICAFSIWCLDLLVMYNSWHGNRPKNANVKGNFRV